MLESELDLEEGEFGGEELKEKGFLEALNCAAEGRLHEVRDTANETKLSLNL